MKLPLGLAALLFASLQASWALARSTKREYSNFDYYVLEHIPHAGTPLTDIADVLQLELVERVGQLENFWVLRRPKSSHERRSAIDILEDLKRRASDSVLPRSVAGLKARELTSSIRHLSLQTPRRRIKRDDSHLWGRQEPGETTNATSRDVAERLHIADPSFGEQWHLVNDEFPDHMVNVVPVWDMNITGEGVIAAMVDDGLDFESDDLAANFDAENSYDFNDHVDLPKPVLFDDHHGTRCAGQIAAVKNNVCGVGIAYNAKVAGIRILSGPISDIDESAALNYGFQNTAVYSCSWGPADDGRSMEGPSYLIQQSVVNGILNGRGGKGSVFVFASGNGAAQGDQCNFDGYTNSIYSVTVAAVDHKGLHPYYSEPCAANMVVTYSSGSSKHIVTTDVGKDKCSRTHGGTSAAAPNAVGIFTLALSARPDLTWRDIQHLCVRTAKMINPDDPDWENTAIGRNFSYKYGYGSLDAYAFVKAAQSWTLVKPQAWIMMDAIQLENGVMTAEGEMSGGQLIGEGGVTSKMAITRELLQEHNFGTLEHITVKVWISHSRRGEVEVELVSPSGVRSMLAGQRKYDTSDEGFQGWTFMTVKHWDEDPLGDWTIRVSDQQSEGYSGHFLGWTMTLWGSVDDASKAKQFVLPDPDTPFPPPKVPEDLPITTTSTLPPSATSSTKKLPKPTENLPDDHGQAEGEKDKPAFSSAKPGDDDAAKATASPAPSETLNPTPDEGWFPGMYNLVSNSKWVFGAIGAVAIFGIASAAFFLYRRRARRRGAYASLGYDDELQMGSRGGAGGNGNGNRTRTRELYDAFGEVSDDDDYADEETGLRKPLAAGAGQGLGFHEQFLDDDPETARTPEPSYRDEPESSRSGHPSGTGVNVSHAHGGTHSPASASADGSWEHASDATR